MNSFCTKTTKDLEVEIFLKTISSKSFNKPSCRSGAPGLKKFGRPSEFFPERELQTCSYQKTLYRFTFPKKCSVVSISFSQKEHLYESTFFILCKKKFVAKILWLIRNWIYVDSGGDGENGLPF